jgi:hypothetical protein
MASFYAELYVEGRVYPVLRCSLEFQQATRERGRVAGRVRHGPLQVLLDVPDDDTLLAWAADPHKQLSGHLIFFDTARLTPHESIQFEAGHCVRYQEEFEPGLGQTGAYQCAVLITAPRFVLGSGSPAATPLAMPQQLLAAAQAGPTPHLAAQLQQAREVFSEADDLLGTKLERYQKRLRLLDAGRQRLSSLTAPTAAPALALAEAEPVGAGRPGPLARLGSALGFGKGAAAALSPEEQLAADRNQLSTALSRLTFNNVAVERAKLSANVYNFTTTPDAKGRLIPTFSEEVPEGWRALEVWDNKETGFAAAVYQSDFEEPRTSVLAFRGTNPTEWGDLKADVVQGLGVRNEQYEQAILLATEMKARTGGNLQIVEEVPLETTGHSLGGGLAAAASVVTGVNAFTFNAAGLHPKTVGRHGVTREDMLAKQSRIENVYSSQDPLNAVQNALGGLIPRSIGNTHVLPKAGFHPITSVVAVIEQQKKEDATTIRRFVASP